MNASVIAQKNNGRFFFTSLAFAVVLIAVSGFFVNGMFSNDTSGIDASTKVCLSAMRTNGFNPTVKDDELTVKLATTTNVESTVYKSGVIIASCPAYTLNDYCAGAGCQTPGVNFTLKKKDF